MAACSPSARDAFLTDLRTVKAEARSGLSAKQATDKDSHWMQWKAFVSTLQGVDPYLNCIEPHLHIPFLQVFAHRLRHGRLTTSRRPVQSKRVQAYLRTVAEEIRLGSKWRLDPRYGNNLSQHLELALLSRSYSKQDPPPKKVKPVPLQLPLHACLPQDTAFACARTNMTIAGYYYMLRPGEYTFCRKNNHPFRLQDITFKTPWGYENAATAPVSHLRKALEVLLYFTDQKDGIKGQAILHGDTTHPWLSPLKAILRQVLMLRRHKAAPNTPLYTYFDSSGSPHYITASDITKQLKLSCAAIGASLGIKPSEISARALRNGGCVALIRAGVDPLLAKMVGRWRSWAMVEYLQASCIDTTPYAQRMFDAGSYTIPTHQTLPQDVLTLVQPFIEE